MSQKFMPLFFCKTIRFILFTAALFDCKPIFADSNSFVEKGRQTKECMTWRPDLHSERFSLYVVLGEPDEPDRYQIKRKDGSILIELAGSKNDHTPYDQCEYINVKDSLIDINFDGIPDLVLEKSHHDSCIQNFILLYRDGAFFEITNQFKNSEECYFSVDPVTKQITSGLFGYCEEEYSIYKWSKDRAELVEEHVTHCRRDIVEGVQIMRILSRRKDLNQIWREKIVWRIDCELEDETLGSCPTNIQKKLDTKKIASTGKIYGTSQ